MFARSRFSFAPTIRKKLQTTQRNRSRRQGRENARHRVAIGFNFASSY